MKRRTLIQQICAQEDLNFLLTNRVPRQALTHFMGWFSKIEHPWVRDASIAIWKFFSEVDLSEAEKPQFTSLHDAFTRALRAGARPTDPGPEVICSPCDGIVGACGHLDGVSLIQAKGFPYTLPDLLGDTALAEAYRDGQYVTLRLTAGMYHRFHAPQDCRVRKVTYISGDTWNVNPIALARVERLFCKNERAVIETTLSAGGQRLLLVPVAAILVASIRLHWLDVRLHLRYKGPNVIPCDARFTKGEEMGWFEHGSTILVIAPKGVQLDAAIVSGHRIRQGEALMRPAD